MPANGPSGQKEVCSSADMLIPLLSCVISARSDLHVLTQEKKPLNQLWQVWWQNSHRRIGRDSRRRRLDAGDYSLSLEKVLFKFVCFNFENKKLPFTPTAHCSHLYDWQKIKFLPKPAEKDVLDVTRNGCAPSIIHCNIKRDLERMATADLDRAAVIFNHQSRPSATVL